MARMLFQKKGAPTPGGPPSAGPSAMGAMGAPPHKPALVISIGEHKPNPGDAGMAPHDPAAGDGDVTPVMCPKCGCVFDPATGHVLNASQADDGSGQVGKAQSSEMPDDGSGDGSDDGDQS